MATRQIICDDDPLLRKKSREIDEFNERLHILLDDMRETLALAEGAGLAAPQVGVLRRAVLIADGDEIIELVNPEIKKTEGECTAPEGCLSVPGIYGTVRRPERVTVTARDRFGKAFELTGEGIVARAICHETDHLNGVLFTDKVISYISPDEIESGETED